MSHALHLVAPRVPVIDPRTGLMSREWYLFFVGLHRRVGGEAGSGNDELDQFMQFDIRESEAAETRKNLAALAELTEFADGVPLAEVLKALDAMREEIALLAVPPPQPAPDPDPFTVARDAELAKRIDALEILGAFTR